MFFCARGAAAAAGGGQDARRAARRGESGLREPSRGVARAVERGRVRVLKACTDVLCQQRPPRKRNRR